MGHVLCHDLTQIIKDQYKDARFRKGHVVTEEDIPVLLSMGKEHLYVWEMTPGMLHEDEGAERLLALCMSDHMERSGDVFLAMGNSDVPVGQYTQKIFTYYGLDEASLASAGVLTYGSNVKEVTTQVSEGTVDCGVIYATDAFSAGLTVVDEATAEMCGQVIYPAAVMKNSANPDAAKAFLDFLSTDEAMACFEAVGFSPMA